MAYCTVDDVRALIAKFTVGDTSRPTTTQATSFVDQIAGEIDLYISVLGVTVPITSPAVLVTWLEKVNAEGAAATVLKAMFPDVSGTGETPAYAFFEKRYNEALKLIKQGDIISDLIGTGDANSPSTYLTENPDEEINIGEIAEPIFNIGKSF